MASLDIDELRSDTTTQASIESTLRSLISQYENLIGSIKKEAQLIDSSSAWKDTNLKSYFINTLNNYVKSFDDLKDEMEKQVNELSKNTKNIDSIEAAFS